MPLSLGSENAMHSDSHSARSNFGECSGMEGDASDLSLCSAQSGMNFPKMAQGAWRRAKMPRDSRPGGRVFAEAAAPGKHQHAKTPGSHHWRERGKITKIVAVQQVRAGIETGESERDEPAQQELNPLAVNG